MSVVVGYVPDATGYLAVTQAAREAGWRDTGLVIVNVVGAAGYTRPTSADERDLDALAAHLDEDGVRHEIRHVDVASAQAADEILRAAEQTSAELVVVGVHRRSAVAKALLGSTAQRVLLEADCPVLTVRAAAR